MPGNPREAHAFMITRDPQPGKYAFPQGQLPLFILSRHSPQSENLEKKQKKKWKGKKQKRKKTRGKN